MLNKALLLCPSQKKDGTTYSDLFFDAVLFRAIGGPGGNDPWYGWDDNVDSLNPWHIGDIIGPDVNVGVYDGLGWATSDTFNNFEGLLSLPFEEGQFATNESLEHINGLVLDESCKPFVRTRYEDGTVEYEDTSVDGFWFYDDRFEADFLTDALPGETRIFEAGVTDINGRDLRMSAKVHFPAIVPTLNVRWYRPDSVARSFPRGYEVLLSVCADGVIDSVDLGDPSFLGGYGREDIMKRATFPISTLQKDNALGGHFRIVLSEPLGGTTNDKNYRLVVESAENITYTLKSGTYGESIIEGTITSLNDNATLLLYYEDV